MRKKTVLSALLLLAMVLNLSVFVSAEGINPADSGAGLEICPACGEPSVSSAVEVVPESRVDRRLCTHDMWGLESCIHKHALSVPAVPADGRTASLAR